MEARQLQLFSLINVGAPPPFTTLDQDGRTESRNLIKDTCNPASWWIVTVTAKEVLRSSNVPLQNLTLNEIASSRNVLQTSRLRLRVGWGSPGFGHEVDLDLGSGVRLGIASRFVEVSVVGPQARTHVVTGGIPVVLDAVGTGLYADTVVSASITSTLAPPRGCAATLTQVFERRLLAPARAVPIPPFARSLQITRSLPDTFTPFEFVVFPPGESLRTFDFNPADPGATFEVLIPQFATHVMLGASLPGNNSDLSLIWKLSI